MEVAHKVVQGGVARLRRLLIEVSEIMPVWREYCLDLCGVVQFSAPSKDLQLTYPGLPSLKQFPLQTHTGVHRPARNEPRLFILLTRQSRYEAVAYVLS